MHDSLRILMTAIVDYAGLFPPAALDMATSVANFERYTRGEHAWMLGRFVVPVARLSDFEKALLALPAAPVVPGPEPELWRLSALIGEHLDADIERIFEFNRRHAGEAGDDAPRFSGPARSRGAVVDAIELKAGTAAQIDHAMRVIPEQLEPYFEIPVSPGYDLRGPIAAMSGTGARAKIRTGGVTPDVFPPAREVARFIGACSAADVAFKATAGLHHPIRASYPLTYEPGCPRGTMFGFLNVFLAAAFVKTGRMTEADSVQVLEETNSAAFAFDSHGVSWRDRRLDLARLARVRESFAVSFGSCSFEEPIAELRTMGLLG